MRQVVKQPPGKILPAPEPRAVTVRVKRSWSDLSEGTVGPYRRFVMRRAARASVDKAKRWYHRRSWWIIPLAVTGAVLLLAWGGWGIYVLAIARHKTVVETYCSRVGSCDAVSGFVGPLLAVSFATAVFLLWPVWRAKRPIIRKAKASPRELVPTAGTIVGRVVGRTELCLVIMQALRDRVTRRPFLLVGGVGTGKTAVLVQLTKMLAERGAVPVAVRLRDVENELNFGEAARKQFCKELDSGMEPDGQNQKIWRQLRRDDKIVVLADGLEEAFPEGNASEKDRDNLIRRAIQQAHEQKLPLVIASRPHHPLEATAAAIMELEPLSEEAALDYVEQDSRVQDEHRLDWIVETAGVADAPLYLQITRQLYREGMLEHLTTVKNRASLDTRGVDCSTLRWRLLDTWCRALADGHLHPELALPVRDRKETVEVISALACIGLLQDTLEVKFEDLIDTIGEGRARDCTSHVPANQQKPAAANRVIWAKLRQAHWGDLRHKDDTGQPNPRRYRWLISLATTRGDQLGLVEAYGNRVRFPHSVLQAYLGSRFLDLLVEGNNGHKYLKEALSEPGPGRELLIALVLYSRAEGGLRWNPAQPNGRAGGVAAGDASGLNTRPPARRRASATMPELVQTLLAAAEAHTDAKAFDIYAAALEIDSVQGKPAQRTIGRSLCSNWDNIRTGDRRTLEEAKLGLVHRYGDALREAARRRPPDELAYADYFEIGYLDDSYPARLAIAQEIGAGGDAAFRVLFGDAKDPLEEYTKKKKECQKKHQRRVALARKRSARRAPLSPNGAMESGADRGEREERELAAHEGLLRDSDKEMAKIWREFVLRAWLAPMLAGSAAGRYRQDAEHQLEAWLQHLKPERRAGAAADLPISLEIALAQGFKGTANRRERSSYSREETRAYLIHQAEEMLKYARYWFTQLTLIHALCLWALPDDTNAAAPSRGKAAQNGGVAADSAESAGNHTRTRGSGPAAIVARWIAMAGTKCAPADQYTADKSGKGQRVHPFVAQAGELAALALECGRPERFIWIDESGIISKVGSRPPGPTDYRKHNLWIPPSVGWSALDKRAQQLVADVLVMLNLTERAADSPEDRELCLERANKSTLPPCLTKDRKPLQPSRTVGQAKMAEPGTSCLDGCQFELCPYPPSGARPRAELGEAFSRRQQTLLAHRLRRPGRKTAPWQGIPPKELQAFWAEMARRSRPPEPSG